MHIDEFKRQVIARGIESAKKYEKRPDHLAGALEGFELCRVLNSPADFEEKLQELHEKEAAMRLWNRKEGYWRQRYISLQVEFVYERMKVAWSQLGLYSGPFSARAVLGSADILGVEP